MKKRRSILSDRRFISDEFRKNNKKNKKIVREK